MEEFRNVSQLPEGVRSVLTNSLRENEAMFVAWQPTSIEYTENQKLIQLLGLAFFIPSLVIGYFFWATNFVPVMTVLFMLVGAYLLFIPWFSKSWANRTLYVFTDQRAILILPKGYFSGYAIESFQGNDLKKATIEKLCKNRANIIFRVHRYTDFEGDLACEIVGFFGICNPEFAFSCLDQLRR